MPRPRRVFTFNGKSMDSTVIDATSGQSHRHESSSPGKPEEAVLDGSGNMCVNLEDKSSIQEFDTKSYAIKGIVAARALRWPLRHGLR